jgi:hypothetical protein
MGGYIPGAPRRRRYLNGDELVDMLARRVRRVTGHPDCTDIIAATIHELQAVGVDVSGLVQAEVDEADVVTYPDRRSLGQRIADAQPRITLSRRGGDARCPSQVTSASSRSPARPAD